MVFDPDTMFIVDASLLAFTNGGIIPVSAYDIAATGWTCTNKHNVALACQVVAKVGTYGAAGTPDHLEDLSIFWCGYQQDSIRYSILSGTGGPDIMLTPTMDGCTFGIGHSAPDGTCLVSHANNASSQVSLNKMGTMPKDQRTAIKNLFAPTGHKLKYMLQPDDYRWGMDGGHKRMVVAASTYGLRAHAHWKFYRHRYIPEMGNYKFLDTKRVK